VHQWHEQYSLLDTEVLGFVACRVLSKILGIGSAERNWGDVKHLKIGKRSHLSSPKVRMAAVVYSAACIERGREDRHRQGSSTREINCWWGDDDLDNDMGLEDFGVEVDAPRQQQRFFHCWIEEWELNGRKKDDAIIEAKFHRKYNGLVWHDPDHNENYTAQGVEYRNVRGAGRGWHVVGLALSTEVAEAWDIELANEQIAETDQPYVSNVVKQYEVEQD
jgi:hypothetical protein